MSDAKDITLQKIYEICSEILEKIDGPDEEDLPEEKGAPMVSAPVSRAAHLAAYHLQKSRHAETDKRPSALFREHTVNRRNRGDGIHGSRLQTE